MKMDKDVIFHVLKKSESLFLYIPMNLKKDLLFLITLTQNNVRLYHYLSSEIKNNRSFLLKVFAKNKSIKHMVPELYRSGLTNVENFQIFVSFLKEVHKIFHCFDLYQYIQTFLF